MADTSNLFISGNSSGLGLGLSRAYQQQGWQVYGCSRRGCPLDDAQDIRCDLSQADSIPPVLDKLLVDAGQLDLVILNAGILGEIKPLSATSMTELRHIMDINAWANKVILDWLLAWAKPVHQVVMISSGAAVMGNKGWGGYALSKAMLNMLARLYSHEFEHTHISAIAPGLVDSAMMDYLCEEPDPATYPALARIRDARGTGAMPKPDEAAARIIDVIPRLKEFESGSYIDIRQIIAPDEYENFLKARNQGPVSR